eukprot:15047410-Ditylum_brightwellii.AAC.1
MSVSVVNDMTIRIVFILISMALWTAELLDVKGTLLNMRFQNGKMLYMNAHQGFEQFYPSH